MQIWLAGPLLGGTAQGSRHLIELFAAFGLTALIGLERTIQGKVAGLRTQTIVGTSSALIMLISKYGFGDVLSAQTIELDPSRVAAQIVSGIGFLGAGIIITRRGAVHGLTTAAAVWESAAIGMAAGAGLLLLAIAVVALHFVSALAFNVVERQLNARLRGPCGCTSSTKAVGVCYASCCKSAGSESGSSPNSMRTRTTTNAIRSG
jgi:putative Mg2+ transporter-C (MgtC) family protein